MDTILNLGKDCLWRTILLLKNLLLFRTMVFVQESNKGAIIDRLFYTISIFGFLIVSVKAIQFNIIPTNLLLHDPTLPEQYLGGPISGALPIFITVLFSYIVSRKMNIFPILNLYLMNSLMTCIFMGSLFILPLTSQTLYADYELMKAGQGQRTEAFGMTCGNLERRAEQLSLERKQLLALPMGAPPSPAISRKAKEWDSLNESELDLGGGSIFEYYRSQNFKDHLRILQLEQQIENARVLAREKYRIVFFSFAICLVIYTITILIISITHSYKMILIFSDEKISRSRAHIAAVSSIAVTTLLIISIYFFYNGSKEFDKGKILTDPKERNIFLQTRGASLDLSINLLHIKFIEYSSICPKINKYSLW